MFNKFILKEHWFVWYPATNAAHPQFIGDVREFCSMPYKH